MTVIIRDGVTADRDFVVASWCDSYRTQVIPWANAKETKLRLGPEIAGRLGASRLVVACDSDDSDRIYGWAVGSPGVLHYVYVRDTRRRLGLAGRLVAEVCGAKVVRCSTLTPMMQATAAQKGVVWRRKAVQGEASGG